MSVNTETLALTAFSCEECCRQSGIRNRLLEAQEARTKLVENAEKYLYDRGVPKRFLSATMEQFDGMDYLTEREEGLFLTGPRGIGKTHLAVAYMKHYLSKGEEFIVDGKIARDKLPLFISMPNLLFLIKQTWRDGSPVSEKDVIMKYADVGLLILDDLGAEASKDWSHQILYLIIDRRYGEMKKTVITSNLSIQEVSTDLDDRIASRIAGMCEIITLQGPDRRLEKGGNDAVKPK